MRGSDHSVHVAGGTLGASFIRDGIYETRVNYLLSEYYAPVICAYDLSKFSAT